MGVLKKLKNQRKRAIDSGCEQDAVGEVRGGGRGETDVSPWPRGRAW